MLLHNIFIKKHIVRTQTEKRERVANSFIFFSQRKESRDYDPFVSDFGQCCRERFFVTKPSRTRKCEIQEYF
jgi:hypothetical protein